MNDLIDNKMLGKPCHLLQLLARALLTTLLILGTGAVSGTLIIAAQAHDFGGGTNPDPAPDPDDPPPPCKEKCGCGPEEGDPISLLDGAERPRFTDLRVNGLFPIVVVRQYDNQSSYDTPIGYGWAFHHDRRLFEYPDGKVIIRRGCGYRDTFEFTGGAYVTPPDGVRGQLTENADGSFVFAYFDGTFDYFDAEGRLIAEEDPQGNRHEFIYADSNSDGRPDKFPLTGTSPHAVAPNQPMIGAYVYRLTRIQERGADGNLTGRYVDFVYDDDTGRLQSSTSDDGRTVTYGHDEIAGATRGNLIQVNGLENIVHTYQYEDPLDDHNLTYIQQGAGETPYINTYDDQDRVIEQTHGFGKLAFNYQIDRERVALTRTVTDEQGTVLYTAQTTYEFFPDGFPKTITDALGNQTRYQYDTAKNLKRRELWDNGTGTLTLLQAVDYNYNAQGDKIEEQVTLDSGEVVTRSWTYDQGWVTSEQVVSSLDPTKIFRTEYALSYDDGVPVNIAATKRRRDDGSFQTTNFNYDAKQRLVTTTLPDGVQIVNEYANGSLYVTKTYFKDSGGNALPHLQQRFGYDSEGNQTDVWDARNNNTHTDYDAAGRVTVVINALGEQTLYTYNQNNLTQIEVGRTEDDGEGQIKHFLYDGDNNLIETQRKDDDGNLLTFETYRYDSEGNRLSVTDAEGRTTRAVYDALGRLSSIKDALGNATTFAYDAAGNLTNVTDALSRETRYVYDDLNRQIRTEQVGINPPAITQMAYDGSGNVIAVTDAEGNTTTFTYDTLSRQTAETRPLGQTLVYVYDGRDRLDYRLTARGHKIDYEYAPWGSITREEIFSPDNNTTTPDETVLYQYDLAGNLISIAYDDIQPLDQPLYEITYDALNREDITTAG